MVRLDQSTYRKDKCHHVALLPRERTRLRECFASQLKRTLRAFQHDMVAHPGDFSRIISTLLPLAGLVHREGPSAMLHSLKAQPVSIHRFLV
jgi:hypothetical protein